MKDSDMTEYEDLSSPAAVPRLIDRPLTGVLESDALEATLRRILREGNLGAQNYAAHGSSPVVEPRRGD